MPLNKKKPPPWFIGHHCYQCNMQLKAQDYTEIGMHTKGKFANKLFIRYQCFSCMSHGELRFTDNCTIEDLCTELIERSNFMNEAEIFYWKRSHKLHQSEKDSGEEMKGNDN